MDDMGLLKLDLSDGTEFRRSCFRIFRASVGVTLRARRQRKDGGQQKVSQVEIH